MSYYFVDGQTMTNIANSIREKTKTENNYTASEMASAIMNISGGMDGYGFSFSGKNLYVNTPSLNNMTGRFLMEMLAPNGYNYGNICQITQSTPKNLILMDGVVNLYRAFNFYIIMPPMKPVCGNSVKNFAETYAYSSQLIYGEPVCGPNVTNMYSTYWYDNTLTGQAACGNNVIDMRSAYSFCSGLQIANCGSNVLTMYNAYFQCYNLIGQAACGNNVIDMRNAYIYCNNLIEAACGPNVKEMNNAYFQCHNLINAASGNNVLNMYGAYYQCSNLQRAACGPNVINMYYTYLQCPNLIYVECGDNVVNASYAYLQASILNEPKIGNNVIDASFMYYDCVSLRNFVISESVEIATSMYAVTRGGFPVQPVAGNSIKYASTMYAGRQNLIGSPVFGRAMQNMDAMYGGAINLGGDCVIQHPSASMNMCFSRTNTSPRINMLIRGNSFLDNNIYANGSYSYLFGYGTETDHNWVLMENGYYSPETNVYIYNNYNYLNYLDGKDMSYEYHYYNNENQLSLEDIYDYNAEILYHTFTGIGNNNLITGNSYICSDNVLNFRSTYREGRLLYEPVCGNNVLDMSETYYNTSIIGQPICGPNVINMHNTYYLCRGLTGNPACGDNVINMVNTYFSCEGLTGNPACGDNVTNMSWAYYQCTNLTGEPVISNKVIDANRAYYGCTNIIGNAIIGNNVAYAFQTFSGCTQLNGMAFVPKSVVNSNRTFAGCAQLKRIIFEDGIYIIGNQCCTGCYNANVYVPESVCIFGDEFYNNSNSVFGGVKHICYYGDKNTNELTAWGVNPTNVTHHQYDINNLPNVIMPTCTETGRTGIFPCKYCGLDSRPEDDAIIPALGHTPIDSSQEISSCIRCSKMLQKVIQDSSWKEELKETYYFTKEDNENESIFTNNNIRVGGSEALSVLSAEIFETIDYIISYSVDSENNYDWLTITLDDIQLIRISGLNKAGEIHIPLEKGIHKLTLSYKKDGSGDSGIDMAIVKLPLVSSEKWIVIDE